MGRRAVLFVLVLLLLTSRSAAALTILDIVQLSQHRFSDAQIIAIIDATNAVFELEAADLPRLKQLGVTEPVIRALLTRRPAAVPQVSKQSTTTPRVDPPATQAGSRQVAPPRPASLADLARPPAREPGRSK